MPLKLYKADLSPVVRAVFMLADKYNLDLERIDVDLVGGDQFKPEFLKLNPLHTAPVLVDGDLVIQDSHAILIYLADTYGNDDSLYPKDVKQRALIHQKLFFHNSGLYPRLRGVAGPIYFEGKKGIEDKQLKYIEEGYDLLEEFLTRSKYLAADNLTIADISAFPTVSALTYILPPSADRYPKLKAWLRALRQEPFQKNANEAVDKIFGLEIREAINE